MAKINAGAQSTWRKKAGAYVYRKWRNLNVAAIYQPIVKNPRTAQQMAVRNVVGALSTMGRGMANVVNIGLKGVTKGTNLSPRNYFTKVNFDHVMANIGGGVTIDWQDIVVARGGVAQATHGVVHVDNPAEVECTFTLPSIHATESDYEAFLVVYSQEKGIALYESKEFGSNEQADVTLATPADWSGLVVKVYGFIRYNGDDNAEYLLKKGDVCDSMWLGSQTIS